ncbi:hypothetical protein BCL57_001515 [Agromyces flavus]|nr:hypothetical protein [Agromyces flavus]MCP2367361.1 hypothetical protein [Agromyces flavus]GGI45880.1 hypothetical protein GCM10010932_11800 [Agromyces flavus]
MPAARSARAPWRSLLGIVFIAHGVITLAAAVVLAMLPAAIPATVGIELGPDGYLLSYFLAAAELAIGVLSLGAARLTDPTAVGLIVATFVVFHLATALLELVFLFSAAPSAVLVGNLVVRLVAAVVFVVAWRFWRRRAASASA